jgi:zinc transporter 1/2/3
MTVFTMFFIELMASRFDVFGEQHASDLEKSDPAKDLMRASEKYGDTDSTHQKGKHYPIVCHWVA